MYGFHGQIDVRHRLTQVIGRWPFDAGDVFHGRLSEPGKFRTGNKRLFVLSSSRKPLPDARETSASAVRVPGMDDFILMLTHPQGNFVDLPG